jgi:D-serine deaminase-like pyridoxal phosphate-dependent protein
LLIAGSWLLVLVLVLGLVLVAGCWLLGADCWVLGAGCWVLIAGCWVLIAGCWVLGAGCWVLVAECWEDLMSIRSLATPTLIEQLETPAALVDLDRLAQNLDRMAAYCVLNGLALRPHVKTHKSRRVAAAQLRLGATGLTCATPRELEVMAEASDDLLLAHPPVGAARIKRVLSLPREVRLTVALDSIDAVEPLAEAADAFSRDVGVYVEVDVGMKRVGVRTPGEVITIARRIKALPPLSYRGVAFYPGHIRQRLPDQGASLSGLREQLATLLQSLGDADLSPAVVSGGSTPAAWRMHEVTGVTEVRPGTYVYNDRATESLGACAWEDCALTVLATVVSTAVPGQAVVDAGSKALGREPLPGGPEAGYGCLMDRPDVRVVRMSEEHGVLDLGATGWRPRVGDLVRIVPNHVCIVVHLNDTMYGVRGDVVESTWPVTARGRGPARA